MNAIAVLYTLCVVTLCRGTKCGESLDPLQVLDISNVDGSKVTVEEESADGVSYKSYVPKANKDPKGVIDGEAILWKASSEKEKCTLADLYTGAEYGLTKLHIRDGVKSRFECFKKVDDGWQSIEEDEFDDLLEGMRNGSKQEEDVKAAVEGKANESTAEGLFLFPELPEDNATEDDSTEEDDSPTRDLHEEIVSPEEHNGGPQDVVLESIGSPTELPDEPILQTPIHAPLNDKGVALDISSPDSSKVSVTSRTSEGVESTLFYPEGHVSIVCIMDSGMPILAEAGTICTETYLFSKPGFPLLLKVHTNGGGSNACTYFEKVDGGWTKVEKDDFDGKLGTMKNGMVKNVYVQNASPVMEQYGNSIPTVQNVESVPNTHIGTPYVNNHQGSHSGSYPVGPPTITSPPPKDFVDKPMAQHTTGTILKPEPVHPTAPPMPEENVLALLPVTPVSPPNISSQPTMGLHPGIQEHEQDIHINSQHIPQEPIPLPMQNDPHAQPIPQVQVTSQVGNILMLPQQVPLMDEVPLLPTPPMDIPSTVEPKVTYNTLRNEVHTRVLEEPGEMMMVKPVKTKRKKLREESVPVVKTVDLTKGDSPSTIVYEVVEDGITHKSYFPKNHTFDNIMDGDKPVWTAGAGEESTLVFTYSKLGHPTILSVYVNGKSACFEKNGKEWSGITEAEFNAKHEAMKAKEDQEEILQEEDLSSESTAEEPKEEYVETHVVTVKYPKLENLVEKPTSEVAKEAMEHTAEPIQEPTVHYTAEVVEPLSPVTVDLSHLDPSKIDFSESSASGIAHKSYFPKGNNFFDKIQDGETEVWKAKNGEKCSMAYSSAGGDIMRITLKVDNDEMIHFRYLVKSDGVWKTVDQKEYDAKLNEMKSDSTESLSQHYIEPTLTFDINVADTTLVTVSKETRDEIMHKSVVAKDGLSFTQIVDGDLPIWTACNGTMSSQLTFSSKGRSRLLTLQVQHDGKLVLKYFEKKDGMWTGITNDWFNEKLERMKFEDEADIVLDIENVDVNLVESYSGLEDGVSFSTYEPKNGVIITSIVDGDYTLWEASADEIWKHLYSYSKDGFKISTVVFSRNGVTKSECFERVKYGWKWISEEEFANKRSLMRTGKALIDATKFIQSLTQCEVTQAESPEQNSIVPYTLDLSTKPDDDKATFYEHTYGEITYKLYTAKDSASITEIRDGEPTMWKARDGERSVSLRSFSLSDGTTLYRIDVVSNDIATPRCFEKVDGGIITLDYTTYTSILEHMLTGTGGARIDVSVLTLDLCNYFMYIEGGLHNIYMFPSNAKIKSIFYGKSIWDATDGEECTSAHIYTDKKGYFAKITVKGRNYIDDDGNVANETTQFFEYQDNEWKSVSYTLFQNSIEQMAEDAHDDPPFENPLDATMDIGNPDAGVATTYKYTLSNVDRIKTVPHPNKRINKVSDGNQIIWEAGGNHERCLLSDVLSQGDFTLLFLHVKKGAHIGIVYFEKVDECWREIGRTRFDAKHEAMKKGKFKHSARELYKYLTSSDPISIDVLQENDILYDSFDYSFAGNAIKLIVPKYDQPITKLTNDTAEVYSVPNGEKLEYAEAYLNKDKKPELMHIVLRSSNGSTRDHYMELKNGNWEPCDDYTAKMDNLVISTEWKSNFTIDLSTTRDGDSCTSFEADILGVTTKHFFPGPGYHSIKVMDGDKVLWESPKRLSRTGTPVGPFGGYSNHCLSCILYTKEGIELLGMALIENKLKGYRYFEKVGSEWKSIAEDEFANKHSLIRSGRSLINTTKFVNFLTRGKDIPEQTPYAPSVLDLSAELDEDIMTSQGDTFSKAKQLSYVEKNGISVTEIIDKGISIWKARDSERSVSLRSCSFSDGTTLYRIDVLSDGRASPICFERSDSGVTSLSYSVYSERMGKTRV